jgi:hypothetical protein
LKESSTDEELEECIRVFEEFKLRSSKDEFREDGVRRGVGGEGYEVSEETVSESCSWKGMGIKAKKIMIAAVVRKSS